jgi:citrate lyase subunit beta/citryl-CoA lyase
MLEDRSTEHVLQRAERRREELLHTLRSRQIDLPLRYWRQQAHFTTPAADEAMARKAIEAGTEPMGRLLARYEVSAEMLAQRLDLPAAVVRDALAQPRRAPLVMLDGEDAQAPRADVALRGREAAVRLLREANWGGGAEPRTFRFYRPSGLALPTAAEDLTAVLLAAGRGRDAGAYPLDGIVFPKVEHPEEIDWVMATLDDVEAALHLDPGRIRLALLVESGWCLAQLGAIVRRAIPRLCALILGLADYSADVGLPAIVNRHPVAEWARAEIVNAAGAAGVPAIDAMTLDYPVADPRLDPGANRERFLARVAQVYHDAVHAREMGMAGKWVGHPAQLFAVLLAFDAAPEGSGLEREAHRLAAYEVAVQEQARGATIIDGAMADRATDRHARMRLRRAVALGHVSPEQAYAWGVIDAHELSDLQAAWGR